MSRNIFQSLTKFLWRVIKSALITAFWVVLLVAYARYVEPNYLWVTHHNLAVPTMSAGSSLKIVQISDLHNHEFRDPAYFTDKVNKQQPDLIVLRLSGEWVLAPGFCWPIRRRLSTRRLS